VANSNDLLNLIRLAIVFSACIQRKKKSTTGSSGIRDSSLHKVVSCYELKFKS